MYCLEAHLVSDFKNHIKSPHNRFSISHFATEFYYKSGRVDIIGQSGKGYLYSFEAKLHDWKKALDQAYRYTSFSHFSYILLPKKIAKKAKKHDHEFKRRSVGLCFIDNHRVKIEIPAFKKEPIQPWLTDSAVKFIMK